MQNGRGMGGNAVLLKDITALRGPSGWEDAARDAIRKEAEAILAGRESRVYGDTMGNLYAWRKGTDESKPHVMLAAHMDEVGFIIRFAGEDGPLRFDCVGGVDPRCVVSKRVLVGENAVPGVIGVKAIHLMSAADRKKARIMTISSSISARRTRPRPSASARRAAMRRLKVNTASSATAL